MYKTVSGQLPRRTIPHRTGFGPDEWCYSVVVVLLGSCPDQWGIVLGIVVLVGNGWALFLSGGELSSWGVVLEPSCTFILPYKTHLLLYSRHHGFNCMARGASTFARKAWCLDDSRVHSVNHA